jgi:hypothetical protein
LVDGWLQSGRTFLLDDRPGWAKTAMVSRFRVVTSNGNVDHCCEALFFALRIQAVKGKILLNDFRLSPGRVK